MYSWCMFCVVFRVFVDQDYSLEKANLMIPARHMKFFYNAIDALYFRDVTIGDLVDSKYYTIKLF
jgi:hypothetical protein